MSISFCFHSFHANNNLLNLIAVLMHTVILVKLVNSFYTNHSVRIAWAVSALTSHCMRIWSSTQIHFRCWNNQQCIRSFWAIFGLTPKNALNGEVKFFVNIFRIMFEICTSLTIKRCDAIMKCSFQIQFKSPPSRQTHFMRDLNIIETQCNLPNALTILKFISLRTIPFLQAIKFV